MQDPHDVDNTERDSAEEIIQSQDTSAQDSQPSEIPPTPAHLRERQHNAPVTSTPRARYAGTHLGQVESNFHHQKLPINPYPVDPSLGPFWGSQGNHTNQQYSNYAYPKYMGPGSYASAPPYVQPPSPFPYQMHTNMPPWQGQGIQAPQGFFQEAYMAWPITRAEASRTRKERAPKVKKSSTPTTTPVTPQRVASAQSTPQEGNLPSHVPRDEDRPSSKQQSDEYSDDEPPMPKPAWNENAPKKYAAGGGDGGDDGDSDNSEDNSDNDDSDKDADNASDNDDHDGHDSAPDSDNNKETRSEPKPKSHHITTSVMQVKATEMNMTRITMDTIEEFRFKAEVACKDLKNLNPAIWISKPVLTELLKQAKKDAVQETKTMATGIPDFLSYPSMTASQLFEKIGERNKAGKLVGVEYIARIMTHCISDTTHLFETCLKEFQQIECRGNTCSHMRGMYTKIEKVYDHWTEAMLYEIERNLAKNIIKTLSHRIQRKCFETNFYSSWVKNKDACQKQVKATKDPRTPDTDIKLWLNVLDFTLSTYEEQLNFSGGIGQGLRPRNQSKSRKGKDEDTLRAIRPAGKWNDKNKGKDKNKSNRDKNKDKDAEDNSHMICFNCGEKGKKTGHENCAHEADPNAAGVKAKKEYREKLAAKRKKGKSSSLNAIVDTSDSESNSDSEEFCMIKTWEQEESPEFSDSDFDENPPIPPSVPQPAKILKPTHKKLAIFQDAIVNSQPVTVMFDTGALGSNGNWITNETAVRLGAFLKPTKKKKFTSPLFPNAKYTSATKTCISILFVSFGFEIEHIEFRVMDDSSAKSDIILGLEFIEMYDIMSYLTNPEQYCAIQAPLPAMEEALDWDEGIHSFQSAILDLSGKKTSEETTKCKLSDCSTL